MGTIGLALASDWLPYNTHARYHITPPPTSFNADFLDNGQGVKCNRRATRLWKYLDETFSKPPFSWCALTHPPDCGEKLSLKVIQGGVLSIIMSSVKRYIPS